MVKYLIKLSRWLLLLLVVIFFAVQVPSTFLTFDNISNVLRVSAFLVILALGQGIVIISGNGGIDLSNGSVAALSSCISALMISGGVNIILAVIVGLLVGAGIGLVNGLLVSVVKLPPFVATYGMDSAVRGAAYILMKRHHRLRRVPRLLPLHGLRHPVRHRRAHLHRRHLRRGSDLPDGQDHLGPQRLLHRQQQAGR